MIKLYISFCLLFILQKGISQPWASLGSDEQTSNSIFATGASTFFTQVSADGVPYISYLDDVSGGNNLGDFKVHVRRYSNGLWEFAGGSISPAFPGSDDFPVALEGNIPYVAYSEAFTPVDIQNRLTVKRLNSNTGEWDLVGQQGFSDGAATATVITTDNGKIYVAYQDGAFNSKITVKYFDNSSPANGWQTVGTTGFSNGFVLGINIVVDNGIPYVTYLDFSDNLAYVKKFNGTAWEDVGTNNPAAGQQVVVRSLKFNSGHTPYITFVDSTSAGIVRNLNAANEWITTGNQPLAAGIETIVSMEILNDIPFVAFGLKENGITQVNVKRFNAANNSWPDVGDQPVTASTEHVNNVSLVKNGDNKLLLVFRNLNTGVYAKTFDAGGILPVALTAFDVTRQNNKSLLQWVTSGGQDNKLFEIEQGVDAITFKKIGEVVAKVPTDIPQVYSFVHFTPARGINYYRLKQVDKDGKYAYSKITSITFNVSGQSMITVFPNPVKDILHTEYLTEGGKEIIIRDIEGKIIKQLKTTAKSIDINVADLPKGTYFISLYGDKITGTKAFMK